MGIRILKGYLQLCRPPNLPTAAADIFAGLAISGFLTSEGALSPGMPHSLLMIIGLVSASILLYAGGVVLNDVFDAELDKVERPERPIPSGLIKRSHAAWFGAILLVFGVSLALVVGRSSALIAAGLAISILIYDASAKKNPLFGPLFMGICRGLNLWLGMSFVGFDLASQFIWIPVIYIFAITSVSRGEVSGGNRNQLILAMFLYAIAIFGVGFMIGTRGGQLWWTLVFLLLFASMVYLPLIRAYQTNTPEKIRLAVKGGVLGLIAMDATWVVGFAGVIPALLVLSLLPLSGVLSRRFAVT